jgi:2-keto-4-pentenoate hydratase/2-oxohepta-3-ene-1,7-dioic acid hydratase in catechol pathway
MKLITGTRNGQTVAGWLDGDTVVICATGPDASGAVLALIAGGDAARADWAAKDGPRVPVADIRLMAPIPEPRRDIFCVGKNYHAHAAEFHKSGFDSSAKEQVPSAPVIFTKATTSVVGPGDTVRASIDPTASVDYEGELAVVIGKRAFGVSKAQAMDHVFGYVIVNDVTSRELQKRHNQWVIGKGCDTFCPMGPWIATADEVGDPTALELTTETTHSPNPPRQQPLPRQRLASRGPIRQTSHSVRLLIQRSTTRLHLSSDRLPTHRPPVLDLMPAHTRSL